ncbi:MAG: SH3 domain-containing protein [Syntrophales bacterium]
MRSKSPFNKMTLLVSAFILLFVFSACGGGSAVKSEPAASAESPAAAAAAGPKETPLAKKYDKIVFQQFEYDPKIEADYPGAAAECEKSALEAVIAKKTFASAVRETTGAKQAGALLVKAKITNLRIVSTGARMWGGAFAGSSEMSLQMQLIDAASGAVLREKELSTNNNPWAASWTGGSSDRSLPTDLGKMVAEYLGSIQPQQGEVADSAPPVSEKKTTESNTSKPPAAAKVEAKPTQIASENVPSTSQAAKTLVVIKTASVRSEPTTKSKILATLKKGTKVESLGRSGSWFKIKLSTGATGWVFNSLVTEQK